MSYARFAIYYVPPEGPLADFGAKWLGWDVGDIDTARKIANNAKQYWENKPGMMKYLWQWWLNGTLPPDLGSEWAQASPNDPVEGHWSNHNFFHYYYAHWKKNVMAAVKDYLHNGYGVSIRLYNNQESTDFVGHALTVWGYRYYADGTVIGLWVTDSDDDTSELRLLPVTYLSKWIGMNLYELKWRFVDTPESEPYQNWLIEGVQALKPQNANFLRVRKAGTGEGNVVGDGINCGENCIEPYQPGTQVTLTAIPETGSVFLGWEGACSGTETCIITVDDEKQVIAHFVTQNQPPETFMITTVTEPGAVMYPLGTIHNVAEGEDMTFIFSPDDQHLIVDVVVDGYSIGPVTMYTFIDVDADHSLEVKTLEKDARLAIVWKKCMNENGEEIACVPGENATIIVGDQECDSECMRIVVPFEQGTAIILQAIPDEGKIFEGWETTDEDGNLLFIDRDNAEKILYRLEDIFLRAVIRDCSHC
jgi:hypothetical protein